MLILARYPQQAILIGEVQVTILTVVARKHGRPRVTLGIDAPSEIRVLRVELPRHQPHERNISSPPSLELNTNNHRGISTIKQQEEADV
ncbi:MAG TPA: carbon storage regulator [Ktedonobacteraceae bacterium]|nr:carbon storage regulator [Ktedonobacteraceae bacterium]